MFGNSRSPTLSPSGSSLNRRFDYYNNVNYINTATLNRTSPASINVGSKSPGSSSAVPRLVSDVDVIMRAGSSKESNRSNARNMSIETDAARLIAGFVNMYFYTRFKLSDETMARPDASTLSPTLNSNAKKKSCYLSDIRDTVVLKTPLMRMRPNSSSSSTAPLSIHALLDNNGMDTVLSKGRILQVVDPLVIRERAQNAYNIILADSEATLYLAGAVEYLVTELITTAFKFRKQYKNSAAAASVVNPTIRVAMSSSATITREDVKMALEKDTELNLIRVYVDDRRRWEYEYRRALAREVKKQEVERRRVQNTATPYSRIPRMNTGHQTGNNSLSLFSIVDPSTGLTKAVPTSGLKRLFETRNPRQILYRDRVTMAQIFNLPFWKDDRVQLAAEQVLGSANFAQVPPDDRFGYNIADDQFVVAYSNNTGYGSGNGVKRVAVFFRISHVGADNVVEPEIDGVATTAVEDPSAEVVTKLFSNPRVVWIKSY